MDLELTLDAPTAEFVAGKIAAGEFSSPEEVIRAALHLLEEQDALGRWRMARLGAELDKAEGRPTVPSEEVMAMAKEMVEEKRRAAQRS